MKELLNRINKAIFRFAIEQEYLLRQDTHEENLIAQLLIYFIEDFSDWQLKKSTNKNKEDRMWDEIKLKEMTARVDFRLVMLSSSIIIKQISPVPCLCLTIQVQQLLRNLYFFKYRYFFW